MKAYLELIQDILDNGEKRDDRTGVGTLSVFGRQLRFNLSEGFPAVTTKKLAWKSVVSELLWFIEGTGDERRLCEILHGRRDPECKTIWTENAEAAYWKLKARFPGDLGRVYGVQWRHWRKPRDFPAERVVQQNDLGDWISGPLPPMEEIDQLANLIEGIKTDPYGRRHIINSWNVAEMDQMALPPCHVFSQFYVSRSGKLSCHMYQRSVDVGLGLAFNIASYALLTHLIAQVCDLSVGDLIVSTGDTHIYLNHVDQMKQQLSRQPMKLPTLWLNPDIRQIDQFTMDDIKLNNYQSHSIIKMDMAV